MSVFPPVVMFYIVWVLSDFPTYVRKFCVLCTLACFICRMASLIINNRCSKISFDVILYIHTYVSKKCSPGLLFGLIDILHALLVGFSVSR